MLQVASLKTQISTYQKQAIEAKMAGDASMAGKVELESKVQSATEEIAFLRKTYDEVRIFEVGKKMTSLAEFKIYIRSLLAIRSCTCP